jgi:hypothetical protein
MPEVLLQGTQDGKYVNHVVRLELSPLYPCLTKYNADMRMLYYEYQIFSRKSFF